MCFGTPNLNQDRVEKPGITHYSYLKRVLLYLWSAADGGGLIFDRDSSERNDLLRRNVHGGTNTHITHIYPQLRKSTQTLKKSRSHPVQLYRIAHNTYIHLFEH